MVVGGALRQLLTPPYLTMAGCLIRSSDRLAITQFEKWGGGITLPSPAHLMAGVSARWGRRYRAPLT